MFVPYSPPYSNSQKDADGMANSVDLDQIAQQSDPGLLFLPKPLRIIMVTVVYEPHHEKICLWGFRPGNT